MSENPKHYLSDAPCKKCKGRTRYKSTNNCVPCAKAAVRKGRADRAAGGPVSAVSEIVGTTPTHILTDGYEDLL